LGCLPVLTYLAHIRNRRDGVDRLTDIIDLAKSGLEKIQQI
jgi:hypothetical protein